MCHTAFLAADTQPCVLIDHIAGYHLNIASLAIIAYSKCIDFPNLLVWHGQQKTKQTRCIKNHILKIKELKTTNWDCKITNKQDIRYYSTDSNGQDNIQLPI